MKSRSELDPADTFSVLADSLLEDAEAAGPDEFDRIWQRFHQALKSYVQRRLSPRLRARGQASDVIQSAFVSFWKKLEAGVTPPLDDDEHLWRYLVKIARRKLAKMWKRIYTKKRGAGKEFAEADLGSDQAELALAQLVLNETERQLEADLETILSRLDLETQTICSMKLASMTNREIAQEFGCSLRKVERKGELLRRIFAEYLQQEQA